MLTAPAPRIDIVCDDLATLIDVGTAFELPVSVQDPLSLDASQGVTIPSIASVLQLGGLSCAWSTGAPAYDPRAQDQVAPDAGLFVTILPDAATEWNNHLETDGTEEMNCTPFLCSGEQLVGEYWVDVWSYAADPTAIIAFTEALTTRLSGLGASAPASQTPPAVALGGECEDLAPLVDVSAVLGSGDLTADSGSIHPQNLVFTALDAAGARDCTYTISDEYDPVASIEALPAGGWAVEGYVTNPAQPAPFTSVELVGLAAGDRAFIACTEEDACQVSARLAGNWVSVRAGGGAYPAPLVPPARDAVIALAELVVATVYA